ncbi:unnamed protein product, partial [Oncorhynchus mykiss]
MSSNSRAEALTWPILIFARANQALINISCRQSFSLNKTLICLILLQNRKTNTDNMVEWTDAEKSTISAVWGKVDINEIGPLALG